MTDHNSSKPNSTTTSIPKQPPLGRPPILDGIKREQVLAILANGGSRRLAARYVNCHQSTITNTAHRDPQFAERLAQAESGAEVELLRCLRRAAREEKNWRAATWLLERRNPHDYALRRPDTFTAAEVRDQVQALAALLAQSLPGSARQAAIKTFDHLLTLDANDQLDQSPHPVSPPPSHEQPRHSMAND